VRTVYDLLVIGAGPAGSACARRAAGLGLECLVLERSFFPRTKPCAGGLTSNAVSRLDPEASALFRDEASSVEIGLGQEASLVWREPGPVVATVNRRDFDSYLAERAGAAGSRFEFGAAVRAIDVDEDVVTVGARGREWSGRYVVAADGAGGVSRRAVGLPDFRQFGAAYVRAFPPTADALLPWTGRVLFDLAAVRGGYGWIFSKQDHLNVGICVGRPLAPALLTVLDAFVSTRGFAGWRLEGPLAGRVPARSRKAPVATGRVLFAGDAAGLVSPATGEGISHALSSGCEAADAVARALRSGADAADIYAEAVRLRVAPAVDRLTRFGRLVYAIGPRGSRRIARSRLLTSLAARLGPREALGRSGGELLIREGDSWRTLLSA